MSGINDLLVCWINEEIERGTIPADIPTVEIKIEKNSDRPGRITLGDLMLNPTSEEAQEFSKALRQMAAGHLKSIETRLVRLKAAGVGFAIESVNGRARFTGGANLMTDVADRIDAVMADE